VESEGSVRTPFTAFKKGKMVSGGDLMIRSTYSTDKLVVGSGRLETYWPVVLKSQKLIPVPFVRVVRCEDKSSL
jgi:hypothetical protein